MLLIGSFFVIAALVALFSALGVMGQSQTEAEARLAALTPQTATNVDSLLKPEEYGFAQKFAPKSVVARNERNYLLAGRPAGLSVARILTAKVVLGAVGLGLGLAMYLSDGGALALLILLVAPLMGYFGPDFILSKRAEARQEDIEYGLPDLLDQITIAIESGSSFETALARVGQNGEGPLADEIVRTVQDIALGMPRRDAYQAWSARCEVDSLNKFIRSVVQGEEFGVPMSDVVRNQANEMRTTRKIRAEGKANQVAVKMLFPLMVTILPVLFIVAVGPAIINVMNTL